MFIRTRNCMKTMLSSSADIKYIIILLYTIIIFFFSKPLFFFFSIQLYWTYTRTVNIHKRQSTTKRKLQLEADNNYHGLMTRICLKSRTHSPEDHSLFPHNLYVWLSNVSIERNKMLVVPLTWRTFPPSGKVSKASGRGVFEESRNTEWVVNEKFCDSKSGSIESLWTRRRKKKHVRKLRLKYWSGRQSTFAACKESCVQ